MSVNVDIRYAIGRPGGSRTLFTACPFHHDTGRPNYAVYPDGAKCFNCGASETAVQFLRRVGIDPELLPVRSVDRGHDGGRPSWSSQSPERPGVGHVQVWHRALVDGPRRDRLGWFVARGIWPSTITSHRLGHEGDRFVIPVWGDRGSLKGIRYRGDPRYCDLCPYTGREARYGQPRGQSSLVYRPNPNGRITVITEGELDALVLSQYGYDAITSTGGADSLPKDLERFQFKKTVYLATDQDEAGDKAAQRLMLLWPNVRRVLWDGKDVSEAVGRLSIEDRAETIQRWINEATEV